MRMRRMRRVLRRLPLLALVVEGPLLALVVDGHGDRARLSASEADAARCQESSIFLFPPVESRAEIAIDRQAAAASQNEAEESDESEDEAAEAAGERTTRVRRPRGGITRPDGEEGKT